MQKEVEAELDRLVGQEGTIHTKMLALQRMGYSLYKLAWFQKHGMVVVYLSFGHYSRCSANCLCAPQAQPTVDRRRRQSAVRHDHIYLQPG